MENKSKIDYLDSLCRNLQVYKDTDGSCPLIDKRLIEGDWCYYAPAVVTEHKNIKQNEN